MAISAVFLWKQNSASLNFHSCARRAFNASSMLVELLYFSPQKAEWKCRLLPIEILEAVEINSSSCMTLSASPTSVFLQFYSDAATFLSGLLVEGKGVSAVTTRMSLPRNSRLCGWAPPPIGIFCISTFPCNCHNSNLLLHRMSKPATRTWDLLLKLVNKVFAASRLSKCSSNSQSFNIAST